MRFRDGLMAIVFLANGFAQQPVSPPIFNLEPGMVNFKGALQVGVAGVGIAGPNVEFIRAEVAYDGKLVKGAPYSAEAVTEMTQTLVDGNRIYTKSTSMLYRDGEGRTRREQTLPAGPQAATDGPQVIFINDPVAGVNYVLETKNHVARKAMASEKMRLMYDKMESERTRVTTMRFSRTTTQEVRPVHEESLGTQIINGLQAEGTRNTITIPAGQMGNERPIELVSERWYSPQLQTVVKTRHTDPRMGETVYQLTNINLAEPAHSLFEVPADYTIQEGK